MGDETDDEYARYLTSYIIDSGILYADDGSPIHYEFLYQLIKQFNLEIL